MFTQMQNPFEEVIQVPDSYFSTDSTYPYYSQKSSNSWGWIFCILFLISGVIFFFVWKEKKKIEENEQKLIEDEYNSLNRNKQFV